MKHLPLFLLAVIGLFAQKPDPLKPAVPVPVPAVKPETVVAKVNGRAVTAADFTRILETLPQDTQKALLQNPAQGLQSLFLMEHLKTEADLHKLAAQSPYKEQLALQRMQILAQAEATHHQASMQLSEADEKKAYDADPARFDHAHIRVILITYADPKTPQAVPEAGKEPLKTLTELEAKAKIEALLTKARAGADFGELAKANSEDKATAGKGGEYALVRRSDNVPAEIRDSIFALKPGEISEPIRQPAGFFIIKLEDRGTFPFSEVKDQLAGEVKQQRFDAWMKSLQKQYEVSIENTEFFPGLASSKAAAPSVTLTQVPPAQ